MREIPEKCKNFFSAAFALLLVVICVLPFCYVFIRSFWTNSGITFQSYYDVFLGSPQYLFCFWKSLGMSACIAAGQLVVSVLAGYGFAKYKFPGRDIFCFSF